jgi:transketolase
LETLNYDSTKPIATRKAFGNALKRIGSIRTDVVAIDGDTKNSTYIDAFGKEFPDRFVELFIAEQNMAGVAVGLSARGYHPVMASFACFLSRAADQLRMAAFSGSNILVDGSHAGVSIGEDGPSQMGLEDLSLFRSVRGSTVFYPSDAISTERLTELALGLKGIVYMRTGRPETAILYKTDDTFAVGGSKSFESTVTDSKTLITVIAAGVTLHEALKAQKTLTDEHIAVRVIDCYSVKPIDTEALKKAGIESKAIIVVEDHYKEGGLGERLSSTQGVLMRRFTIWQLQKLHVLGKLHNCWHTKRLTQTLLSKQ